MTTTNTIIEKVRPINLNGGLLIETPMEAKNPFAFYSKDEDMIVIAEKGEGYPENTLYSTFPLVEVKGSSLMMRNATRDEWISTTFGHKPRTFGNIYGFSSPNVDDRMLYVRTREHIGEWMTLVLGGNLFHIETVEVYINRCIEYGSGDGGHTFEFKTKSYRDFVKIANAFRDSVKLSFEENCFTSKANKFLCKLEKGEVESPFIDCTKY